MDDSWHLIEDILIRRFILAKPEAGVDTLLVGQFVKITAYFLSSGVISHFESALHAVIALAFFIHVLTDSGGNTASQSATLVIRSIATGDLSLKRWFDVLKKEAAIGLFMGASLGTVVYFTGFFWKATSEVGLVIGLSMIATILWANLLGSLLPIVLTKLKLDPAVISSPLLSTFVDTTSLLIYFSMAELILRIHYFISYLLQPVFSC